VRESEESKASSCKWIARPSTTAKLPPSLYTASVKALAKTSATATKDEAEGSERQNLDLLPLLPKAVSTSTSPEPADISGSIDSHCYLPRYDASGITW